MAESPPTVVTAQREEPPPLMLTLPDSVRTVTQNAEGEKKGSNLAPSTSSRLLGTGTNAIATPANHKQHSGNDDLYKKTHKFQRTISASRNNRPVDIDKVDELDDSDPYGMPWHHDGPYQAIPTPQEAAQERQLVIGIHLICKHLFQMVLNHR